MYRGNINRCYVFNMSVVCGNKETANIYSGDGVEWLLWKQTHSCFFFFFLAIKDLPDHFPLLPFFLKNIPFLSQLLWSLPLSVAPRYPHNPFSFRSTSIHPLWGEGGGNRPARRWWSYHPSPLTVPPSDTPRQLSSLSLSPQRMFVFPTNVGQSVEEDDIRPPGVQTPPTERHLQALESNTWDIIEIRGCVGRGGAVCIQRWHPAKALKEEQG